MAAAASKANTDSPEKAIAAVRQESPVPSASAEEDMLVCPNLRLSTIPDPPAAADERSEAKVRLDAAEKVILHLDSIPGSLVEGSAGRRYLSAVDEIILLSGGGVDDDVHGRAQSLLKTVVSHLGKEFLHVISGHSQNLYADRRSSDSLSVSMLSVGSDLTAEDFSTSMEEEQHAAEERGWRSLSDDQSSNLIPSLVISDLKEIADRMIAAGYQQELCRAYSSARQDFLNRFLSVLGVDPSSTVHTEIFEGQTLQEKVRKWIRAFRFTVRVFLERERELCDRIFLASDELKEESFGRTVFCFIRQLLGRGVMIAAELQSPRTIFSILDMYEAISDVLLDVQALFSGDSEQFPSEEAESIVGRLGKMVRGTLADFGDWIRSENLSKPQQNGQIHPFVRYVTSYIKILVCYSSSLNLLLHDDGVDGGDNSVHGESMTAFGQHMHLWISYLECRIQEISKYYEDDALKFIFLMNNVLYMVHKLEDSELKTLLGDNWVRTHHGQIQLYATCYLRASWSKPLSYLKDDGLFSSRGSFNVLALKERFKNFNLAFQKIWSTQTAWIVPDPQLREDLRLLTLTTVTAGYRSFVGRYGHLLVGVQELLKYIKYTPEDLEKHLSDLFEGICE